MLEFEPRRKRAFLQPPMQRRRPSMGMETSLIRSMGIRFRQLGVVFDDEVRLARPLRHVPLHTSLLLTDQKRIHLTGWYAQRGPNRRQHKDPTNKRCAPFASFEPRPLSGPNKKWA